MLCIVYLCILVSSHSIGVIASSRIDDIIVKFIVDATPILYPPKRLSLQLCISYDDTIRLSRLLSTNQLMHNIRNSNEEFDPRIYNNLEHQNLYILDLDCDYAIKVLRQANTKGMFIAPAKWLLLQDRRVEGTANENNTNLIATYDDSVLEVFEDLAVYPDSDVLVVRRLNGDFLELMSVYRPSPQRGVMWEIRGNWTIANGLRMRTYDVASARRKNLQQTTLKSSIVVSNNNTMKHLFDFVDKTTDPVSKSNYAWVVHIVNRMNATINLTPTDTWGYRGKNGSWNGMIGMLERREIDIGGSPTFLVPERIGVIQYIQLYTQSGSRFIFRRPLLSTVKNIFVLPFERKVWIAIAVFLVLVLLLLCLSTKWEYHIGSSSKSASYWNQLNPGKPRISDNFLILLGAFMQQGYSYEPYKIPTRIITLMLLLAALSLYAAYTANIVGLLQSTTDSIKTIPDLLHSPLKFGVQDVVYSRYYFQSFQDPVRKQFYEQKIKPKNSSWMRIEEGVKRIRNEPFAFHGEFGVVYQLIQNTYLEEEKCGLMEIDYLKVLYPLLVIQRQSPYLEIVKIGALKLRELGLKYHEEHRLYTKKPVCATETSFIQIGFTECSFALVTMGYGILFAVIVLVLECLWYKKKNWAMKKNITNNYIGYIE